MSVHITHTTRTFPRLPYEKIKNAILGASYSLSLVFIGEDRARALNKKHRNAHYIPNILSFELDTNAGEIYITPSCIPREAKKREMTAPQYTLFLFIHGLLHLKGFTHGDAMDAQEQKFMRRFV